MRGIAAQACSSAMRNGWGPSFSRMGYMRWGVKPEPKHFVGWNAAPRVWASELFYELPDEIPLAARDDIVAAAAAPDWRYRLDYVLADRAQAANYTITAPSSWDEPRASQVYLDGLSRYNRFIREDGAGKELVGENNFGELRFEWQADRKQVTHTLWWRMTEPQIPFPHSVFKIPLNFEPEPPALPIR
jgi:hypothetical protein